ncbi:MAG: tRNA (adenosine(37)-N6)-dimethylallyltransferase MiaA [Coriobacteriia bacterium]
MLAIVGPTAAGKSALAEAVALRVGAELVSADSMQVYRGMDIGTAKTPEPRKVPLHCVDLVEPGETYSAALFQRDARAAIEDVASRGLLPIVVGGTGLYVRAALDDWNIPSGEAQSELRRRLEEDMARHGPEALYERLKELDPASAALIHPNNQRRIIRALEMHEKGISYAKQAERFSRRVAYYPTAYLGLYVERQTLYRRIEERVDAMLRAGLLDEVRSLVERGFRDALTASQAIGYKELVPVLEGRGSLEAAVEQITKATRRYAKRQMTWFRRDPRVEWVDVTDGRTGAAIERALDLVDSLVRE